MENKLNYNNLFYKILNFLVSEDDKFSIIFEGIAKYLRTALHIIWAGHHVFVCSYSFLAIDLSSSEHQLLRDVSEFGFAYLTGWNITFQSIFLILALFYDVLEWTNRSNNTLGTKVRYYRDIVFGGLVYPVTWFVFGMFWSLYSIDRELVFPTVYDDVVPWWFNHCVHTNILVVLAVETVLEPRRYPTNAKLEKILCWSVNICYTTVYYSVYFFAHRWLYKIFGILNWWQLPLYQLLIWFSAYFFYLIQYPINRMVHGSLTNNDNDKSNDKSDRNKNGIDTNRNINDNNDLVKRNKVRDLNGYNDYDTDGLKDNDLNDMKPINSYKYRL